MAMLGLAGKARSGTVWLGEFGLSKVWRGRAGVVGCSVVRFGMVGHGVAGVVR